MSRVIAAAFAAVLAAAAIPTAASAGCYSCYAPPQPCCVQQQVAPAQYRTVQETVMVSPGHVIAHRTPAQYRTVMVPQTVMVAPEGVAYERTAPNTRPRSASKWWLRPAPTTFRLRRAAAPADISFCLTRFLDVNRYPLHSKTL